MSDIKTAAKEAKVLLGRMDTVSNMALAGTYEHSQFMSAALSSEWLRIKFCLEVLSKQR